MSSDQRPQPGAPAPVGGHADPHAGQPVSTRGPALEQASGAVILLHGRNAAPANILTLADALGNDRVTYLAPAAAHNTWYPYSFLTPIPQNEPYLSSALGVIESLVTLLEERGMPASKVALMGFSQGACLASEFAVRHPRRYGGLVAFSGGAIGPPGTRWDYPGSFDGTPAFFGCSDVDPHIPLARVNESEEVFRSMGAEVTKRIYPGMGHLVNEDEVAFAAALLQEITG